MHSLTTETSAPTRRNGLLLSVCRTRCYTSPISLMSNISADRADELQNKHTLFGKVVGSTIYSECPAFMAKEVHRSSLARIFR